MVAYIRWFDSWSASIQTVYHKRGKRAGRHDAKGTLRISEAAAGLPALLTRKLLLR